MKTKKILSVVLACMMLLSVVSVSAFALDYTGKTINQNPTVVTYTDAEAFNPAGMVISYNDGASNSASYDADPADFSFSIPLDKNLTVADTAVTVYYNGVEIGTVAITVTHASSAEFVSVNDAQHGHVCAGCGEIINLEDHTFSPWVPNDDATFLIPETETAHCTVCGATFTHEIAGTEGYLAVFAEYPMLATLIGYISLIVKTIVHNS